MTKIITHSGIAHLDDFLSTCLVLYKDQSVDEIIRKYKVSEKEINDSNIWKIDIGNQHDPQLKAFDHHQEKMDDCAFSLLLKNWNIWGKAVEVYPWINSLVKIDTRGLGYFLESNRISYDSFFQLDSFVQQTFLELFQRLQVISKKKNKLLFLIMKQIGKQFFKGLKTYEKLKNTFQAQVEPITISKLGVEEDLSKGIPVLLYLTEKPVYSSHLSTIFHHYKNKLFPEYKGSWVIGFSYNRPKNSICLKRYGSASQIDFSRIKSLEKTYFAHQDGFVAAVEDMVDDELYSYIQHAIL